jgi:hypothetical protein
LQCCGTGTAGAVSFCHDQNRYSDLSLSSGSGSGSRYKKVPKMGFDTLVLKGIRVKEQIKEFQVKINLFPSSFNRNLFKRNFILKIFLK